MKPPLRTIVPHVPEDLETIVLKASARERQARYDSAEELAADLRRFHPADRTPYSQATHLIEGRVLSGLHPGKLHP